MSLRKQRQQLENLKFEKQKLRNEGIRLDQKLADHHKTFKNTFTLTGTLQEIEADIKVLKKEKKEFYKINHAINVKREKTYKKYCEIKKKIIRIKQMKHMDLEVTVYKLHGNYVTESEKINDKQLNLKKQLPKLPHVIIKIIISYFTNNTRCAIWESMYKPFPIISKLNQNQINLIINSIYNDVNYPELFKNDNLNKNLFYHAYNKFYDSLLFNGPLKIKRSLADEKIFLKYTIYALRSYHANILNNLYKFIIPAFKIK
jgi:hypothetical protein